MLEKMYLSKFVTKDRTWLFVGIMLGAMSNILTSGSIGRLHTVQSIPNSATHHDDFGVVKNASFTIESIQIHKRKQRNNDNKIVSNDLTKDTESSREFDESITITEDEKISDGQTSLSVSAPLYADLSPSDEASSDEGDSKETTQIVVFVTTQISSSDQQSSIIRRFRDEYHLLDRRSQAILLFVVGTRSGEILQNELDVAAMRMGEVPGVDYLYTPCR
jgi:hypothetical protein